MAALVLVLGITTSEVMAQMLQLPLRNPPGLQVLSPEFRNCTRWYRPG